MKIVFAGSFDPAHLGHKNTYDKACAQLDAEIEIAVCDNGLKEKALFSLEERLMIAGTVFPDADIRAYRGFEQVRTLIRNSDVIVRGYRDERDVEYAQKLLRFYDSEAEFYRVYFVKIDAAFCDVSSSRIKEMFGVSPSFSRAYLSSTGYEMFSKRMKERGKLEWTSWE